MAISEALKSELRQLYSEFVKQFQRQQNILLRGLNNIAFVSGSVSKPGVLRNGKSYSIGTEFLFNKAYMYPLMLQRIKKLEISKTIYEVITSNNLWHLETGSYEVDICRYPALTFGVISGFLCRNFEITSSLSINEVSFNQSFQELLQFFDKDYIEVVVYLQLRGLEGTVEQAKLNENVSILKAPYNVAKTFSVHYSAAYQGHNINMFEGDYVLQMQLRFPKVEYSHLKRGNAYEMIREAISKWENVMVLGCPGYVDIDKHLYLSDDWPVLYLEALGPQGGGTYHFSKTSNLVLSENDFLHLNIVAETLIAVDFKNLPKRINNSIERLAKSKCAKNLSDRVVELSIALEYLINTSHSEVTLQLCLKTIRLVFENNSDETIFKRLKKFYDFRSKVVHGNSTIELNDANRDLIDFIERVAQKAIVRYIELNKKFKEKQIDAALDTSLHVSKTVNQLLDIPGEYCSI